MLSDDVELAEVEGGMDAVIDGCGEIDGAGVEGAGDAEELTEGLEVVLADHAKEGVATRVETGEALAEGDKLAPSDADGCADIEGGAELDTHVDVEGVDEGDAEVLADCALEREAKGVVGPAVDEKRADSVREPPTVIERGAVKVPVGDGGTGTHEVVAKSVVGAAESVSEALPLSDASELPLGECDTLELELVLGLALGLGLALELGLALAL